VFQPTFLPEVLGDFTFTIDRWKIEQEEIVACWAPRRPWRWSI